MKLEVSKVWGTCEEKAFLKISAGCYPKATVRRDRRIPSIREPFGRFSPLNLADFDAVRWSLFGPKRTSRSRRLMSAFGGKAESPPSASGRDVFNDPTVACNPALSAARPHSRPCSPRSAQGSRTYDLCINVAGRRLYWRNPNHGVTLGNDTIAWTMDGGAMETAYGNIVAVHLNSAGQKITADRCTITFADGSGLLIVNTDPGGYRDRRTRGVLSRFRARPARAPRVRPLSRNPLHRRRAALALFGDAGFGDRRSAGLRRRGPRRLFHLSRRRTASCLCWSANISAGQLGRRALANAPRDYTPDRLPEKLLG